MQNRFYDKMSIALGLPDVASRSQWAPFGRCITPGAMARYIEGGEFYYGLEATFVASVAEEAPKTAEPSKTPLFDHLRRLRESGQGPAAVEAPRSPLTWATPKPVDRWEGFTTNYNTEPQFEGDTHPLQRITDPSDPLHGSAFLRG